MAAGGIALLALITQKPLPALQPATLKTLTIVGTLASISLGYTAYEGGKIRHPEAYQNSDASGGNYHD